MGREITACSSAKHLDFYGKTLGFHYKGQDKMRSHTGAILSLIVFVIICAISAHRLLLIFKETHKTFLKHEYEGYYEGYGILTERGSENTYPQMNDSELAALDQFYIGVGFASTPEFQDLEERGFGEWRFVQNLKTIDINGAYRDVRTEIVTTNCFAFIDEFAELNPTAQRLLAQQDVRNDLRCVERSTIRRLQAQSVEYWPYQPSYAFEFHTCESDGRDECHSKTLLGEWRQSLRGLALYNTQVLQTEDLGGEPIKSHAQFSALPFDRNNSTVLGLELQVDSIESQTALLSSETQQSFITVRQLNDKRIYEGDQEKVLAVVEIQLSSDHVKYVIEPPKLLDWVGFVGGIAVVVFLVGKMINHIFFRKKYISPMMDKLFQVQDVSKISNVRKANYTNKVINSTTSQYKSPSKLQQQKRSFRLGQTPSSVKPMEEDSDAKSGLDQYVAELGKDSADFNAFRKLCTNRRSLNDYRGGRLTRAIFCRRHNFDLMIGEAKKRIRHELDIVRFIKKQRVATNLLWGLSTPWQRAVCRSQAINLVQDKLESEFGALKLRAVRRLEESQAWKSSSSDDPIDPKLIENIRSEPCAQDIKFMKRYIAVCTPEALKLRDSRKRALQREFAPKDLPDEKIFTQDKATEILEKRRLKALQKDMKRAKTQAASQKRGSAMDMSEQYSHKNRDTMSRLELGIPRATNQSVINRTSRQQDESHLAEEDIQQMRSRMAMIRAAYEEEEDDQSSVARAQDPSMQGRQGHLYGMSSIQILSEGGDMTSPAPDRSNFLQFQQQQQRLKQGSGSSLKVPELGIASTTEDLHKNNKLQDTEPPIELQTARTNLYDMGEADQPLKSSGRQTQITDHHFRGMANLQVTDSFKREKHKKRLKNQAKRASKEDSEGNDEMGSKNKLDNSSFLQ